MLIDKEILSALDNKSITIKPFNIYNLGSSSYDVTLYKLARVLRHGNVLDLTKHSPDSKVVQLPYILFPNETAIFMTNELVCCDDSHAADIVGRSNIDRLPLQQSDGFIDPGFSGTLTKRITNIGSFPVEFKPNIRFAQLRFYSVSKCNVPYDKRISSKNKGQSHSTIPNYVVDVEWRESK